MPDLQFLTFKSSLCARKMTGWKQQLLANISLLPSSWGWVHSKWIYSWWPLLWQHLPSMFLSCCYWTSLRWLWELPSHSQPPRLLVKEEEKESRAHFPVFWLGILSRHFSVCFGGCGWTYPFTTSYVILLGRCHLSFLQTALLAFPNPLMPADPGCYFVQCRLSQRETRAQAETLLLFLCFCSSHLKCERICLLFCMETTPISWVRSLKRHRPLKHFLGVWAKTSNNFVIRYMTNSCWYSDCKLFWLLADTNALSISFFFCI